MERGKSVELWFVQVQEVHQYQEVHVRAEDQPWGAWDYNCGEEQMIHGLMASVGSSQGLSHEWRTLVMKQRPAVRQ